jgi:hypothetical protein
MLDAWLSWARRSQIGAFVKLYDHIKRHRQGIIAAVTHGLSNGLTESVNKKLRLITRIAYGFRSTDNLIALGSSTEAATAQTSPAATQPLDPRKPQENQIQPLLTTCRNVLLQ